jgi:hypothetical protein
MLQLLVATAHPQRNPLQVEPLTIVVPAVVLYAIPRPPHPKYPLRFHTF